MQGFTLVEMALATFVLGIGLVFTIGLMSEGLRASEKAGDDSRVALVAEETMAVIVAEATRLATWGQAQIQGIRVEAPAWEMWDPATVGDIETGAGANVNVYAAEVNASGDLVEDYALNTEFRVDPIIPPRIYGVSLTLSAGEFTGTATRQSTFYREVFNPNL